MRSHVNGVGYIPVDPTGGFHPGRRMHLAASRLAMVLGVALGLVLTSPVSASEPDLAAAGAERTTGLLRIICEQAVPFSGYKDGGPDLLLELALRDGQLAERGWAWLPSMVATEHPVRVTGSRIEGMALQIDCEVEILDQFPYYEGGRLQLRLDLRKYGRTLRGDYQAQATALTEKERTKLWQQSFGMAYPRAMIRGRVGSGQRQSRSIISRKQSYGQKPPVYARGSIDPLPPPIQEQPALKVHPRLAGTPEQLTAILARSKQGLPQTWFTALTTQLQQPARSGALRSDDDLSCPGFLAAGHALLAFLHQDEQQAAAAWTAAEQAIAALEPIKERRWDFARNLAGLAVAYDCCHGLWSAEQREAVLITLAKQAWHIAGLEGMVRHSVYNDKGLLGSPATAAEPHLGMLRGAAGLAFLAIHGDPLPTAAGIDQDQVAAGLAVCQRSVQRYLRRSFGVRGCPIGNSAADESIELLVPFVMASRHLLQTDLVRRSGAQWIARWGMRTRAMQFDAGDRLQGFWLPMAAAMLPEADWATARWFMQEQGSQLSNPFQSVWALAWWRDAVEARQPSQDRGVYEDRSTGTLVLRNGFDERQSFCTIIETAQAEAAVAGAMGRFSVYGLGREWVRRMDYASGDLRWPAYRGQNGLFVDEYNASRLPHVRPTSGGKVQRIRVTEQGTGSIGWIGHGWRPEKGDSDKLEGAKTWTGIGVDYSGTSGADLAMVVVSGYFGFQGRPVTWTMDIGAVPEEAVRFEDTRFIVTPPGSSATMVGTVVYPPTVRFEYVPAAGRQGARINTWMSLPPPDLEDAFIESLQQKILDVEKLTLAEDSVESDVGDIDFDDLEDLDKPDRAVQAKRDQVSKQIKSKVFRVTTDSKMGAPFLRTRVNNHVVVVLTIQEGPAPVVTSAPINADHLLTIGDQVVQYWEYLVEFHTGMRDRIRALDLSAEARP